MTGRTPPWVWLAGFAVLLLALYAPGSCCGSHRSRAVYWPAVGTYIAGPATLNRIAPAPPSDGRLFRAILDRGGAGNLDRRLDRT